MHALGPNAAGPGGAIDVNPLPDTERFSTDPVKFIPSKIASKGPFTLRATVVDLQGRNASGALVHALGVPNNRRLIQVTFDIE